MISRDILSMTEQGSEPFVFLKGCVLRCRWCCNPESQKFEIETMMVEGKPVVTGET